MSTPTGRRLEELVLLQTNPGISAGRLAQRLGVTERTVRRDIAHLRDLGYRIDAEPGPYGGYRLASGSTMPPLVLDDNEALAVAVGLRTTAGVGDLGSAAVTALAKLAETVPARLRPRLDAIARTDVVSSRRNRRAADARVFVALALACRAGEAVRFRHGGRIGDRPGDAQPLRLVVVDDRWYLVASEAGRGRWTTYAVDRITDVQPLGTRLPAPQPPADPVALVTQMLSGASRRHIIRVRLFTSGDLARELIDATVGHIEDDGDDCILTAGTDDLDWAARWLVYRNLDFEVLDPPELTDRLRALGHWLARLP